MANDGTDDIRNDNVTDVNDEEIVGRSEADDDFDDSEDADEADEADELDEEAADEE